MVAAITLLKTVHPASSSETPAIVPRHASRATIPRERPEPEDGDYDPVWLNAGTRAVRVMVAILGDDGDRHHIPKRPDIAVDC